jgi:hypothetical protein
MKRLAFVGLPTLLLPLVFVACAHVEEDAPLQLTPSGGQHRDYLFLTKSTMERFFTLACTRINGEGYVFAVDTGWWSSADAYSASGSDTFEVYYFKDMAQLNSFRANANPEASFAMDFADITNLPFCCDPGGDCYEPYDCPLSGLSHTCGNPWFVLALEDPRD